MAATSQQPGSQAIDTLIPLGSSHRVLVPLQSHFTVSLPLEQAIQAFAKHASNASHQRQVQNLKRPHSQLDERSINPYRPSEAAEHTGHVHRWWLWFTGSPTA